MKISISTSDHVFSGYPKQLIVYCDEKVYKTLDLKRNINLNIDDNVKKIRIVCKNYSRKNILAKIIFFSLSALSIILGTNGSELLDYIFDDTIELQTLKRDICIKYISNGIQPFSVESGNDDIIKNYRSVEKRVFINWMFGIIIPIQIILCSVITILIISSDYLLFNLFLFFLLSGFEFFIFSRVKKAYKFVKGNN